MHKMLSLCVLWFAFVTPALALETQSADMNTGLAPEIGVLQKDADVTILNEGGKYSFLSFTHLAEGSACKVYQGQHVWEVKPSEDGILVRVATVATKAGDCPFGTMFKISPEEYGAARTAWEGNTN